MRSFYRAMLDTRQIIYEKRDRPAADVYSAVEAFVKNGNYSSYRKANLLGSLKLSKHSEEVIASQLGVSVSTVRTHVSNVSNELYLLFGLNFFDMLSNYAENRQAVDTVMFRISQYGNVSVSYVLSDVLETVRSSSFGKSGNFVLKECSQELDFLRRYSRDFLSTAMGYVDIEKLVYLVRVLDGECGSAADWADIVSYLTKGVSIND